MYIWSKQTKITKTAALGVLYTHVIAIVTYTWIHTFHEQITALHWNTLKYIAWCHIALRSYTVLKTVTYHAVHRMPWHCRRTKENTESKAARSTPGLGFLFWIGLVPPKPHKREFRFVIWLTGWFRYPQHKNNKHLNYMPAKHDMGSSQSTSSKWSCLL